MTILFVSLLVIGLIIAFSPKGGSGHQTATKTKPSLPPLSDAQKEALRQAEEVWDDDAIRKIKNRTYKGPLPDYDGAYWSSIYPEIYHTKIAGINFCRGIKYLAGTFFDAELIPEPKNKYDQNAIKIVDKESGKKIGYIPADETEYVRTFLNGQLPSPCRAHIDEDEEYNSYTDRYRKYLYGSINITRPTIKN